MDAQALFDQLEYTPLVLVPENDAPLPGQPLTEREEIEARAASAELLMEHGLTLTPPTQQQREESRSIFEGTSSLTQVMATEPEVILHLRELLNEYDHTVVHDAQQLRNYVTNRLILESTDKNANIRMRALENLGKISDVSLFTEKSEVIHKHTTMDELESKLKAKLEKIIESADVEVIDVAREKLSAPETAENADA